MCVCVYYVALVAVITFIDDEYLFYYLTLRRMRSCLSESVVCTATALEPLSSSRETRSDLYLC